MPKPTIFLLPGLTCDETVWEHQRTALEPFAEIIIPVFRGYDSLREMAKSVLACAPARFSVAGHSMGGRVGFELLRLAGHRIDRFAGLNTGAHPLRPGEAEDRQAMVGKVEKKGLQAMAEGWIPPMLHPARRQDEELTAAITAMILRTTVAEFKGQIHALLNRGDQFSYLPNLDLPVLLLVGDGDGWTPLPQHQEMAEQLPRAKLEIVKGAGHMSPMEKPAEVSKILVEWFSGQEQ